MQIDIFTDASHDRQRKIAAIGYYILVDHRPIKHEALLLSEQGTPTDAEWEAIKMALEIIKNICHRKALINVHTDCLSILTAKKGKFRNLVSGIAEEFEKMGFRLHFYHIKGHAGNHINEIVDGSCLTALREYLKTNQITY